MRQDLARLDACPNLPISTILARSVPVQMIYGNLSPAQPATSSRDANSHGEQEGFIADSCKAGDRPGGTDVVPRRRSPFSDGSTGRPPGYSGTSSAPARRADGL